MLYLLIFIAAMHNLTLFDFDKNTDLSQWEIENDSVMGGKSEGHIKLNDAGHAVFHGKISLENDGGFSSVLHKFETQKIAGFNNLKLHVKGDGKKYQFRIKSAQSDRHTYVHDFRTSGEKETITIPLQDFQPYFHGEMLDKPNYAGKQAEEIGILFGNGKAEEFRLEIDKIELVH